jgi:hypothetical protein
VGGAAVGKAPMLLVVDETKLSDHLAIMMVRVIYAHTVIALVWRAYAPDDYPAERQVALLHQLLTQLHHALHPYPAQGQGAVLRSTSALWRTVDGASSGV